NPMLDTSGERHVQAGQRVAAPFALVETASGTTPAGRTSLTAPMMQTTRTQPTGESNAPAPAIDWTARAPVVAISAAPDIRDGGSWKSDFVNNLGRSESEANPNAKMKLKLQTPGEAGPYIPSATWIGKYHH